MRAVDVRIGHDDDSAVAQLRHIEGGFILALGRAIKVLLSFANPGADGGNHRLDFVVLKKLIDARFLDVDQLAANWKDRLVTPIASLFGRATGGITLDNVKLG